MYESWIYKRSLSDKISTLFIDEIYEATRKESAIGGKILGAGGGGFLLLFVPLEYQEKVRTHLNKLIYVEFGFENFGDRIILYQPNGLK